MTEMLTVEAAHALVVETLVRCNTAAVNARLVADALVGAELTGQAGHGLRRVPSYGAQAASGKVDGHAVPVAKRSRPGALSIDAANGFAYPAIDLAMTALPGMAREQGVAVAGVRRSSHAGVTVLFVEELAQQGMVAMMFVNTPAAIAPWGGSQALYGTFWVAVVGERGSLVGQFEPFEGCRCRVLRRLFRSQRSPCAECGPPAG